MNDIANWYMYILEYGFLMLLAVACTYFMRWMAAHRGLKGRMFGVPIDLEIGNVAGDEEGSLLKVYLLRRGAAEKLVGIELAEQSLSSYQMMPITLSIDEAQQLASLLEHEARTLSA